MGGGGLGGRYLGLSQARLLSALGDGGKLSKIMWILMRGQSWFLLVFASWKRPEQGLGLEGGKGLIINK